MSANQRSCLSFSNILLSKGVFLLAFATSIWSCSHNIAAHDTGSPSLLVPEKPGLYQVAIANEVAKRWPSEAYEISAPLKKLSDQFAGDPRLYREQARVAALWESKGIDAVRSTALTYGVLVYQFRVEPARLFLVEQKNGEALSVSDFLTWGDSANLADVVDIDNRYMVFHTELTDQPISSIYQRPVPNLSRAIQAPVASLLDLDVLSDELIRLSLEQASLECGYKTLGELNTDLVKAVALAVGNVNQSSAASLPTSGGNQVRIFVDALLQNPSVIRCPAFLHSQFSAALSYEAVYSGSRLIALTNLAYLGRLVERYSKGEGSPNLGRTVAAHIDFLRTASQEERLQFFREIGQPQDWLRVKQYNRTLLSTVTDDSARFFAVQMTRLGLQTEETFHWLGTAARPEKQSVEILREKFDSNKQRYVAASVYSVDLHQSDAELNVPYHSWAAGIDVCSTPVSWDKEWWRICAATDKNRQQ